MFFIFINCLLSQMDPNPDRFFLSDDGDQVYIKDFLDWDKKNTFEKNGILFVGSSSIRKWKTAEYFNFKLLLLEILLCSFIIKSPSLVDSLALVIRLEVFEKLK